MLIKTWVDQNRFKFVVQMIRQNRFEDLYPMLRDKMHFKVNNTATTVDWFVFKWHKMLSFILIAAETINATMQLDTSSASSNQNRISVYCDKCFASTFQATLIFLIFTS